MGEKNRFIFPYLPYNFFSYSFYYNKKRQKKIILIVNKHYRHPTRIIQHLFYFEIFVKNDCFL